MRKKKETKGKLYIEDILTNDNYLKFKKNLKYMYYNIMCCYLNDSIENNDFEQAEFYKAHIKEHLNKSIEDLDINYLIDAVNDFYKIISKK